MADIIIDNDKCDNYSWTQITPYIENEDHKENIIIKV